MSHEFPETETPAPRLQTPQAQDTNDDVTRAMPHAVGPEKSVLSSMLQDPATMLGAAVDCGLTAESFYLPGHTLLFTELLAMDAEGKEIELVALIQRLLDRGLLDRCGGPAALADVFTYAPSAGHFRHHAAIVRDKATLRQLIQVSNETIAAAYEAPEEVAELLDSTEARMLAIRQAGGQDKEASVKQTIDEICATIERRMRGEEGTEGTSTGYPVLDDFGARLKPGEIFVIAARPSMGKTSLMMNIVERVCVDAGIPTSVFSLEMTRQQLIERLIYSRARIVANEVVTGWKPTRGTLQRFQHAAMQVAAAPLTVHDAPAITIGQLRAKARRRNKDRRLGLIAIDYLQLMRSTSQQAKANREREVAEISSGLKSLAKELMVPIIVLAQLNRGPETRTGKSHGKPRLSDLRESGSLEQDADMVGLLYRSSYYAANDDDPVSLPDDGSAELILAKNRNGPTGTAPLTFIPSLMRFESGPPAHEPQEQTRRSRYDDE